MSLSVPLSLGLFLRPLGPGIPRKLIQPPQVHTFRYPQTSIEPEFVAQSTVLDDCAVPHASVEPDPWAER
eukprot:6173322-Karenia_brevis.AAC.1